MMQLNEVENIAKEEARKFHHQYVRTEHLLMALLRLYPEKFSLSYESVAAKLSELPYPKCGAEEKLILAEGAKRAMAHAESLAENTAVSPENILAGIIKFSPLARKLLGEETNK